MDIKWKCNSFNHLSPEELYNILKLRSQVFVVEQNCVFLDLDDKDQQSYHLTGWNENELLAYARLLPPGLVFEEISIGRVVVSPFHRKFGFGKLLMQQAIDQCYHLFGNQPIKIGAQLYLKTFYEFFSFVPQGKIYLEDNIEHIEMKLIKA